MRSSIVNASEGQAPLAQKGMLAEGQLSRLVARSLGMMENIRRTVTFVESYRCCIFCRGIYVKCRGSFFVNLSIKFILIKEVNKT